MMWPSRHMNTAAKLGPPFGHSNKAESHAEQCRKPKIAILNPVPKSSPYHFRPASCNMTQDHPVFLPHDTTVHAKLLTSSKSAHSKHLANATHITAFACPAIHLSSLIYSWHKQPAPNRPAEVAAIFPPQPN